MLEQILVWERDLFLTLNGCHTPYWDEVMWLYSGKAVWLPLAVFIILVLAYKKNWKEVLFILLGIALTITLCDQFASGICKPSFSPDSPSGFYGCCKDCLWLSGRKIWFYFQSCGQCFRFCHVHDITSSEQTAGHNTFYLGKYQCLYPNLFRSTLYLGYYSGDVVGTSFRICSLPYIYVGALSFPECIRLSVPFWSVIYVSREKSTGHHNRSMVDVCILIVFFGCINFLYPLNDNRYCLMATFYLFDM